MEQPLKCVGIILDGNRRWAAAHGLPQFEGHRRGLNMLSECVRWARDLEVPHLVLYALSTENLKRAEGEVSYLMDLAVEAAETNLAKLGRENIRIKFIGTTEALPLRVREATAKVEQETAGNTGMTVWIALAYGGRAEIAAAAAKASAAGEVITEESLPKYFWSAGMPDPDIIVRTGGEKRLSNFLLWQGAYSELFFVDTLWPDFTRARLEEVLAEYHSRQRRMGL